ncbi:MAG: hypothetical protein K5683_02915 [Prevotella sp.]|nr:hypothetical protein [Prevotella sp.]
MKVIDFEKAVSALGGELQHIRLGAHSGRQVVSASGKIGDSSVEWDANGRAFVSSKEDDESVEVTSDFSSFTRDPKFDLKFD